MPNSIEAFTTLALACEWQDPAKVQDVLTVFRLLTSSSQLPDLNQRVLRKLDWPANDRATGFYRAAMGDPDKYGQPTMQGLSSFVDVLATANTLGPKSPTDHDFFTSTATAIGIIFKKAPKPGVVPAPIVLARINAYFSAKEMNVALYELLDAYPKPKDPGGPTPADYVAALEQFRAAFKRNPARLAKQIAGTVLAPKQ